MRGGEPKFVAMAHDLQTAMEYAVSAALQAGTLDWVKSLEWAQANGCRLTYEATQRLLPPPKPASNKGFFIVPNEKRSGDVTYRYYIVKVGPSARRARTMARRASLRSAIMHVLHRKHDIPGYDAAATMLYLHRMGCDDLIPMARLNTEEA